MFGKNQPDLRIEHQPIYNEKFEIDKEVHGAQHRKPRLERGPHVLFRALTTLKPDAFSAAFSFENGSFFTSRASALPLSNIPMKRDCAIGDSCCRPPCCCLRLRKKKRPAAAATRIRPATTPPAMAPVLRCLDVVDRSSDATAAAVVEFSATVEFATGAASGPVTGVYLPCSRCRQQCFGVEHGADHLLKALEQEDVTEVWVAWRHHNGDVVLDGGGEIGLGCRESKACGIGERQGQGVSRERLDCDVTGVDPRPELIVEIDGGIDDTVPTGEKVGRDGCT